MTKLDEAYTALKDAQAKYLEAAKLDAKETLIEHAKVVFDLAPHIDTIEINLTHDPECGMEVDVRGAYKRDDLVAQMQAELERHNTPGYYDGDDPEDYALLEHKPFKWMTIEGSIESYRETAGLMSMAGRFPAYHSVYWLFGGSPDEPDPRNAVPRAFDAWVCDNLDAWFEMVGRMEAHIWLLKQPDGSVTLDYDTWDRWAEERAEREAADQQEEG